MKKKTKHFQNCLGVFQGGGCKALAFVGAYKEALERGVFFSRLAGTSAGSIIATLIAGGATPDQLEKLIEETNFYDFRMAPENSLESTDTGITRLMLTITGDEYRLIGKFIKNYGLYSSVKIETWIEENLQRFLNKNEKITFKDLNIPLHIVATELGGNKPKVWSTETTPDDSVAYAVRCSCTIPIYFQPVNLQYIDGGLISNLPTFALTEAQKNSFEKLLCFTFEPNKKSINRENKKISIKDYLLELISSSIDSASHIQNDLQTNLHTIEIKNLPLGTVDFDKIDAKNTRIMIEEGQKSASDFFDREIANLQDIEKFKLILFSEAQSLSQIVLEEPIKNDDIVICLNTTRYVYNIFPTLLHWSLTKVNITFITTPVQKFYSNKHEKNHELHRRYVLKNLGVKIVEKDTLPFEAVLFSRNGKHGNSYVFHNERDDENHAPCFAIKYNKNIDSSVIHSLWNELSSILHTTHAPEKPSINFAVRGRDDLLQNIRKVEQYSGENVRVSIEEVNVSDITFITKYVKSYKYSQIKKMFELYKKHDLELFDSVYIDYAINAETVSMAITPPVAEEEGGIYYLIEGNSRATFMIRELKMKSIKMVVVRNVNHILPTNGRYKSSQILLSDEDKKGDSRYDKFNKEHFRYIEAAVRDPQLLNGEN